LNLIQVGRNYGWPVVSYGVEYGTHTWPPNPVQGRHDGFEQPVFAWTPSIGISGLLRVIGDRFPLWRDDLLIGSLDGRTLWRVRLVDNHPVLTEPIPIDTAVRDLFETGTGSIVIWDDRSTSLVWLDSLDAALLRPR
jgi:glucose/arabinose dehydrogenase